MKWELAALEILARNPMVPGVALKDCIDGLKKLQKQHIIALDEISLLRERINFLEAEVERLQPKWIGIPDQETHINADAIRRIYGIPDDLTEEGKNEPG